MKNIYLLLIVLFLAGSCKKNGPSPSFLGVVSLEVTGKPQAAAHFEKGLLLLHSFEYEDAREVFKEAQLADPEMAMAYWGEAMTHNHSLWSEQDYDKALPIMEKLEKLDYKANCTQLEKDLIEALKILYTKKTEKLDRDDNYSAYMESLHQKYPDNHEVAAFYALSLLGSVSEGRNEEIYEKGAVIAQGIIAENPNHPGALHYLIHSYDDPKHAYMALDAANAYAVVAPDASHALHMPSHIYVAMGMWDEVVSSNIASYNASLSRMKRKGLDNNARGYHAFHWLEYGHLQQGNKEKAAEMVWEMQQFMSESPSARSRAHMVFLKGTYLVETDDWDSTIADIPVETADLNVSVRSQYHFLEGMKAFKDANSNALDSLILVARNNIDREKFVIKAGSSKLCSNISRADANQMDITQSEVRIEQLLGLAAWLNGNTEQTEAHLLKSIELFEGMSFSYGPPKIQKPVRELYADWLVAQGRMEEAKEQYELTLKIGPRRLRPTQAIENM
ncbi:hypothetical protein POV27_02090 [Aureisphaera galaxeae]|uniref:tetratricopeptide repeat protein n=1 Tax=Aureisphaera galaxeae TaxID=1538023 RepID=UPI00234FD67B|nr:hypothetical protein [Aureisphaera galaxeae]MDC8002831.1 hypothetical protein [Aureisphaera galaxeae]